MFSDDAQKGKYNDLGKQVCKFEHSFILGRDMVKEAAKQATVETFDQVCKLIWAEKTPVNSYILHCGIGIG